jgi:hypothetical protein
MDSPKAQYEAPEIVEIGKAEELIQGGGWSNYRDADGFFIDCITGLS